MEIIVTGTGSPIPDANRAGPSPEQYPEWVARAAEHVDGEIVSGDDLTSITI